MTGNGTTDAYYDQNWTSVVQTSGQGEKQENLVVVDFFKLYYFLSFYCLITS